MAVKALIAERDALKAQNIEIPSLKKSIEQLEEKVEDRDELYRQMKHAVSMQQSIENELVSLKDKLKYQKQFFAEVKRSSDKAKNELLFKKSAFERLKSEKHIIERALKGMQDRRRTLMGEMEKLREEHALQKTLYEGIVLELKTESAELERERGLRLQHLTLHRKEMLVEQEKSKKFEHLPQVVDQLIQDKKQLEEQCEKLRKELHFEKSMHEIHEDDEKRKDVEFVRLQFSNKDLIAKLQDTQLELEQWRSDFKSLQNEYFTLEKDVYIAQRNGKLRTTDVRTSINGTNNAINIRTNSPISSNSDSNAKRNLRQREDSFLYRSTKVQHFSVLSRPISPDGPQDSYISPSLKVNLSEDKMWLGYTQAGPRFERDTHTSMLRKRGLPPKERLTLIMKSIEDGRKLIENHLKDIQTKKAHINECKDEIKSLTNEKIKLVAIEKKFDKAYLAAHSVFQKNIDHVKLLRNNAALLNKIVKQWRHDCEPEDNPYRLPLYMTPGWRPFTRSEAAVKIQAVYRSHLLRKKRKRNLEAKSSEYSKLIQESEYKIKRNGISRHNALNDVRAQENKINEFETIVLKEEKMIRDMEIANVAVTSRLVGLDYDVNVLREQIYRSEVDDNLRTKGYRYQDKCKDVNKVKETTDKERSWKGGGSGSPQRTLSREVTTPMMWPQLRCHNQSQDPITIRSGIYTRESLIPPGPLDSNKTGLLLEDSNGYHKEGGDISSTIESYLRENSSNKTNSTTSPRRRRGRRNQAQELIKDQNKINQRSHSVSDHSNSGCGPATLPGVKRRRNSETKNYKRSNTSIGTYRRIERREMCGPITRPSTSVSLVRKQISSNNKLKIKSQFCGQGLGMTKELAFANYVGRSGSAKHMLKQILKEKNLA